MKLTENHNWLTSDDVTAFLRGLTVMGTGGGGSAAFGRAIIENDLARGRRYTLASLNEIPDDALVVSGGIMGSVKVLDRFSPEEIVEQWERKFEPLLAFRAMEEYLGRKIEYLVPFELGGLNTPVILSLAARVGIPVVDGDGLGRAAPETQMTSFQGHGVSIVPMPLVDWEGNVIIVKEASSPFVPDEIGRFVITRAGGLGANAHYPMTGEVARNVIIPGTISFSLDLGRQIAHLSNPAKVAQATADRTGGRLVFHGSVSSIREEEAMGFLVQKAEITDAFSEETMKIIIKNEFMMAAKDGRPVCVFPDLIMMIDEHGRGVMSSELEVGQRVWLIVAPCHPRLRAAAQTPEGRAAFSPERFGQPQVTYQPVEGLSRLWGTEWQIN